MDSLTVNIDGVEYTISPFRGELGFKIQAKILKAIAPALKNIIKSGDEDAKEIDVVAFFSDLITNLVGSNSDDEILRLFKDILSKTYKGNNAINFDAEFSQDYGKLYKLVYEVIIFNYKDVFSSLGLGFES